MSWKTCASIPSQPAMLATDVRPALFTSASMRPQRSIAAPTILRQAASSATSARTTSVSAPASAQAAADAAASASLFV